MSLTEVCEYLGISRNTAYARIKDKTLKPLPDMRGSSTKIPRYRFDRAAVEEIAKTPTPPADTPQQP